jgi:hypothetical protein
VTATEWHRAWTAALSELEADVARVEALLVDDHRGRDHPVTPAWRPPAGLGPLPVDLRAQAEAVLARQLAAAAAAEQLLAANRRQAAMLARIETGVAGAPRPAYVDCEM